MKKDKTEYILFGTNQKAKEKSLERAYRGQSINKTTNYKYHCIWRQIRPHTFTKKTL